MDRINFKPTNLGAKWVFTLLVLLVLQPALLGQQKVRISPSFKFQKIGTQHIHWLADSSNQLTLQDILKSKYQKRFDTLKQINVGVTNNTHWVKISIDNQSGLTAFMLSLTTRLDVLSIYYQQDQTWVHQALGFKDIPFQQRKIQYFANTLPIKLPQGTTVFYFKIKSHEAVLLDFAIHERTHFINHSLRSNFWFGIFYGIILIIAALIFFVLIAIRDIAYLYYFLFIVLNGLVISILDSHYLYFNIGTYTLFLYSNQFVILLAIVILWFTIHFLSLRVKAPVLYKVFLGFLGMNTSYLAVSFFAIGSLVVAKATGYLTLFNIALTLFTGLYLWLKGMKSARFFSLAWFFYIVAGVLETLVTIGGTHFDHVVLHYPLHFGLTLQIIFLSLALVDRVNLLRIERDQAQQEVLEASQENERIVKEQNEQLEVKVEERTLALQKSQEEVMVQNEELRQTQEEIASQRDFLDSQNLQLEEQNHQIKSSIRAAKSLQTAVLPDKEKLDELLTDYFLINRPRDVVSGDFYWVNKMGECTILAVADCTGHGVKGAFMTLIGNSLLDKIIYQDQVTRPAQILNELHTQVNVKLRDEQTMRRNGMDIAVISIVKQADKVRIHFAGAKNGLFYKNATESHLQEIKGSRKSIGGDQGMHQIFKEQTLELAPQSLLFFGSDGLEDQNNSKRKKFGKSRLWHILEENAHLPLPQQGTMLTQALDQFMEYTEQRDDILFIGLKV